MSLTAHRFAVGEVRGHDNLGRVQAVLHPALPSVGPMRVEAAEPEAERLALGVRRESGEVLEARAGRIPAPRPPPFSLPGPQPFRVKPHMVTRLLSRSG